MRQYHRIAFLVSVLRPIMMMINYEVRTFCMEVPDFSVRKPIADSWLCGKNA